MVCIVGTWFDFTVKHSWTHLNTTHSRLIAWFQYDLHATGLWLHMFQNSDISGSVDGYGKILSTSHFWPSFNSCFTSPKPTSKCSSAEVYSYSQPHVLSRLNVLRALKESMSQMPVPNPGEWRRDVKKSVFEMWSVWCRIAAMLGKWLGGGFESASVYQFDDVHIDWSCSRGDG